MPRPATAAARRRDDQPGSDTSDPSRGARGPRPPSTPQDVAAVQPSLLQPRVAVVLGVSERWHLLLFSCRLLSTAPSIWWGLPMALRLLMQLYVLAGNGNSSGGVGNGNLNGSIYGNGSGSGSGIPGGSDKRGFLGGERMLESRLRLTETILAIIWCGSSAYLSFFFTDCLMSRWLLNYTPQATLVRLLTISALNGYLTSWVLHLTGGSADSRLLLPAWIAIATTLTVLYHITQRKINIRKETSMTISIFSIASFISMVALLGHLHLARSSSDYPSIPLITLTKKTWHVVGEIAVKVVEYGNVTSEL